MVHSASFSNGAHLRRDSPVGYEIVASRVRSHVEVTTE